MIRKHDFHLLLMLAAISLLLVADPAIASTGGGGGLPWDTWTTRVLDSFTGPIALLFSVVGFVITGVALANGADFNVWTKMVLGTCFAVSIIVGARSIVNMLFSGAVI